jgi:hypothetical protein
LNLHERPLYDFLDALVSFGYLNREGFKNTSIYSNTRLSDTYLVIGSDKYVGGALEYLNTRAYEFWRNLEEGLHNGSP